MTDKQTQNKELEDYLAGNSKLSDLYRQANNTEPSDFTDKRILAAAKAEVNKPSGGNRHRWQYPVTIAAALLTAIIVIQVAPLKDTVEPDNKLTKEATQEQEKYSAASKSAPERMLDKITILLKENKIQDAEEEYQLFRELFPDYEIDDKKYPELKVLEH